MTKVLRRFAIVVCLQLLAFEIMEQLSVHRPESFGESLLFFWMVLSVAGILWAASAAFAGRPYRWVRCIALFIVMVALSGFITNFYSYHVRPNVGLYEEPDWVAQFPEFQRQQRERIEANLWR